MRLSSVVAGLLATLPLATHAQPAFQLTRIATPADGAAIALYPAGALPPGPLPERWGRLTAQLDPVTRMDGRIARNVSVPTITPVLPPPDKATGAAVVIAPGGAFLSLSMDSEGFEVARRLADRGIAAFVLKYRTNPVPDAEPAFMARVGEVMGAAGRPGGTHDITDPAAAKDALQALRLIRAHAAEWRIDPARVGMIGFSAGAMTALQAVLTGTPADRPAFLGYIYGPMERVAVPVGAPPIFAALAMDDPLFGGRGFGIVDAWHAAGRPVELHAYERGDHGFGTGPAGYDHDAGDAGIRGLAGKPSPSSRLKRLLIPTLRRSQPRSTIRRLPRTRSARLAWNSGAGGSNVVDVLER